MESLVLCINKDDSLHAICRIWGGKVGACGKEGLPLRRCRIAVCGYIPVVSICRRVCILSHLLETVGLWLRAREGVGYVALIVLRSLHPWPRLPPARADLRNARPL